MASTAMVSMAAPRDYSSATSITARPLYLPKCGQTRWGILGSWQLGHCDIPVRRRESWARRVEVRRLECLRLGFGILVSQLRERCPAIIANRGLATALILVAVLSTYRTEPLAILVAQSLNWEGQ